MDLADDQGEGMLMGATQYELPLHGERVFQRTKRGHEINST